MLVSSRNGRIDEWQAKFSECKLFMEGQIVYCPHPVDRIAFLVGPWTIGGIQKECR